MTGIHSVILDLSTIGWVSEWKMVGARYSASATLPFSKNDLTSDLNGNLSAGRLLSLSASEMYEFTVQRGTGIHPGETFDLDYSLMYSPARIRRFQLQAGLARL